jgi:hypothetical protein
MLLISGCERAVSIHSEHMNRGYWSEQMNIMFALWMCKKGNVETTSKNDENKMKRKKWYTTGK